MKGQWQGGKGSAPRKSRDDKAYSDNWDRIFGNKQQSNLTDTADQQRAIDELSSSSVDNNK